MARALRCGRAMKLRSAWLGVLVLSAAVGCSTQSSETSTTPASGADQGQSQGDDGAERAISEADIVQVDEQRGRLYAMSRSGTLAIVDVSAPGRLALLGKARIVGEPFEMYRRGDTILAMTNGGLRPDGSLEPVVTDESGVPVRDLSVGAIVGALDVSDPKNVRTIESYKISGQIADSRLVGNVLYLATYETGSCWQCKSGPRTLVTSFDVSAQSTLEPVDQIAYVSEATTSALYAPWKRSIVVNDERMYIGGFADTNAGSSSTAEGHIEVVDITDPSGVMTPSGSFDTAGPITSRWQLDEYQGVVRVVSQRGTGVTRSGTAFPQVETFRVGDFSRIGGTTMDLPRQEGLKTVRFDGPRAYAITFQETDPLFTLDLSDPASPTQKGELVIPGWVFHLVPRGDRLLGLGLDRRDPSGNLNVSLFDVSDMWSPKLVERVSFGPTGMWSDAQITDTVIAEDQNRIQKAFTISDDGLVAVPFSGRSSCSGADSGVQLIQLAGDDLSKRALLPISGNPRRAIRRDGELLAVSDSHVSSFSLASLDRAEKTAQVQIGVCTQRTSGGGQMWGEGDDYRHCSITSRSASSRFGWPGAVFVGLAAWLFSRRRRAA
jgi:hypothetical protein